MNSIRVVASLGATCMLAPFAAPASAQAGADSYTKLVALERVMPRRAVDTLDMGSLDVSTGRFTGLTSTTVKTHTKSVRVCDIGPNNKPRCRNEMEDTTTFKAPNVVARAKRVILAFNMTANANGTVMIIGRPTESASGQTRVLLEVSGDPSAAQWKIPWRFTAGGHSVVDSIKIERLALGVGAFTLPVFPITILYEPPQDSSHKNIASYSQSKSFGSNMQLSLTADNSTTAPVDGQFEDINSYRAGLQLMGDVAKLGLPAGGDEVSAAFSKVASALGGAGSTQMQGTSTTRTENHSFAITTKQVTTTNRHTGPGKGDLFVLARNVRMGWRIRCCDVVQPLTMAPLGFTDLVLIAVSQLQNDLIAIRGGSSVGPVSRLDSLSIRGLLALDPFVDHDPSAPLDSRRFIPASEPPLTISGADQTKSWSVTSGQGGSVSTTMLAERIDSDTAGALSVIGMGVPETKTIRARMTDLRATNATQSQTDEVAVSFFTTGNEYYTVAAFYDNVFGTFAFQRVNGEVVAQGVVGDGPKGAGGGGLQMVYLTVGGRRFRTQTDAAGRYTFALPMSPGEARVTTSGGQLLRTFSMRELPRVTSAYRAP